MSNLAQALERDRLPVEPSVFATGVSQSTRMRESHQNSREPFAVVVANVWVIQVIALGSFARI